MGQIKESPDRAVAVQGSPRRSGRPVDDGFAPSASPVPTAWHHPPSGEMCIRDRTRTGRPLIALLRSMGGIDFLDDVDRAMISRVVARVDQMSVMALTETASAVFWEAVRETGYSAIAERLEDLQRQQIGANLYRLVDIIEIMGSRGEAPSFAEAERYLRVMQAAGGEAVAPLSSDAKGVRLSTIHGAKGREWDHVFVAGLTEGRLPTRLVPTALDLPATFTPEMCIRDRSHGDQAASQPGEWSRELGGHRPQWSPSATARPQT